jgi:hypothetical protein
LFATADAIASASFHSFENTLSFDAVSIIDAKSTPAISMPLGADVISYAGYSGRSVLPVNSFAAAIRAARHCMSSRLPFRTPDCRRSRSSRTPARR